MGLIEQPSEGEGTLIAFYQRMAEEIGDVGKEVLNHVAQALLERGWVPSVSALIEQLSEVRAEDQIRETIKDLSHRRLLGIDEEKNKVTSFLGSVSTSRTDHHIRLESGIDLYMLGGMELLVAGPMLGSNLTATTRCAQSGQTITLTIADDTIQDTEPSGIAGFQLNWDGKSDLTQVYTDSPLFFDDANLDAWLSAHPELDGLPMSGDLLLFVGMGMATESGNARYSLIGL